MYVHCTYAYMHAYLHTRIYMYVQLRSKVSIPPDQRYLAAWWGILYRSGGVYGGTVYQPIETATQARPQSAEVTQCSSQIVGKDSRAPFGKRPVSDRSVTSVSNVPLFFDNNGALETI